MAVISPLGYVVTAVLCLMLVLLLATAWKGRQRSKLLIVACLGTAAWAGVYALELSSGDFPRTFVFTLDTFRAGLWFLLTSSLLTALGLPSSVKKALLSAWVVSLCITLAIIASGQLSRTSFQVLVGLQLLLALIGLLLIEQLLRNAPKNSLWALKYLCFAIGLSFVFDLYLFSEALLLTALDPDILVARGYVNALAVVALFTGARRDPQLDSKFALSHRIIFFGTTLGAVGGYIVLMALGGYYVREFGGEWGRIAQFVFFFGALLTLAALFFSDTMQSKLTIFAQKHFQRYKYDYRREWLRFTATLSGSVGETSILPTSIRALADIVQSPGGVMWVLDHHQRAYKPVAAIPDENYRVGPAPQSDPLIQFLHERRWIVNLRELDAIDNVQAPLVAPPWVTTRSEAWLAIPLLLGTQLVGFVVLDEPPVMPKFNFEDHDLLKTVGRDVATHISQFEASQRLAENSQFAAYHQLSAFMMHDLKNLVAQLSLVVRNAEKHKTNPEFIDDSINTIANSVARMDRLIKQLGGSSDKARSAPVSLATVLRTVVERCNTQQPQPSIVGPLDDMHTLASIDQLTSVFEHLVRNAQAATPADGWVKLSVQRLEQAVYITVADNGHGMDEAFVRDRLFRPFFTTKGASGMGIGAYQAREYVRSIGGDVDVESAPGEGTSIRVRLPLAGTTTAEV